MTRPDLPSFDPAILRGDRLDAGLTQLELARKSGLVVSTIYDWERGRHQPSRTAWGAVLRVLSQAEEDSPPSWIWRRHRPPYDIGHADDWPDGGRCPS